MVMIHIRVKIEVKDPSVQKSGNKRPTDTLTLSVTRDS